MVGRQLWRNLEIVKFKKKVFREKKKNFSSTKITATQVSLRRKKTFHVDDKRWQRTTWNLIRNSRKVLKAPPGKGQQFLKKKFLFSSPLIRLNENFSFTVCVHSRVHTNTRLFTCNWITSRRFSSNFCCAFNLSVLDISRPSNVASCGRTTMT